MRCSRYAEFDRQRLHLHWGLDESEAPCPSSAILCKICKPERPKRGTIKNDDELDEPGGSVGYSVGPPRAAGPGGVGVAPAAPVPVADAIPLADAVVPGRGPAVRGRRGRGGDPIARGGRRGGRGGLGRG